MFKITAETKQEAEKTIGKALAKALEGRPEGELINLIEKASNGLKLQIKTGLFIDKELNRDVGLVVEVLETKSDRKVLDGISLDLGATSKDILAGVAKDLKIADMTFSVGVYGALNQKEIINTITGKSSQINPKLKIGITLEI